MERRVWRLVVALVVFSAIEAASAINAPKEIYHPNDFLYVRRDKSKPNSLFGYSIAVQNLTDQVSRMLVGAPIENVDGTIYTCDLTAEIVSKADNPEFTCKSLTIKHTVNRNHAGLTYYDHYTWLGANIYSAGDTFAACAPRWSRKVMVNESKSYDVVSREKRYQAFGRCFKLSKTQEHYPIKHTNSTTFCDIKCLGEDGLVATHGGFGWSMTKSHDQLYVGGPSECSTGAYFKDNTEIVITGSQQYECPIKKKNYVLPTLNFGYALASGSFLKENVIGMAVSNPYGKHGRGAVFIDESVLTSHRSPKIVDDRVGALFGAALCAVRVRKPYDQTYDDLLVGSPLYADNLDFPERGAVLVYLGGPLLRQNSKPSVILHPEKGKYRGYFGVSIANLGDMDGDKVDEFAVGAPYEDEQGAVYIFGGPFEPTSTLIEVPYRQRISPGLKGFGVSFAPMVDVDRNGCNELAVGATDSELVAVLRCPIRVIILAQPIGSKIYDLKPWNENENDTSFKIPSCFRLKPIGNFGNTIHASFLVTTTLNADSGLTLSESDQKYTVTAPLNSVNTYCQNITAIAKDTQSIAEYTEYQMKINLLSGDCFNDKYDRGCVVLDSGSRLEKTIQIMTRVGCDDMCHPNLTWTLEFVGNDTIEAGSAGSVRVRMNVSNSGGSAYDWCVQLLIEGAALQPPPASHRCAADVTPGAVSAAYSCKPLPLLNNAYRVLDMEVTAPSLSSKYGATKALVNVTVTTKCDATDPSLISNNTLPIRVIVQPQHITIRSVDVKPKQNITGNTGQSTFSHGYKIRNAGPTTWEDMALEVVASDFAFLELGVPQGEGIINCTAAKGTISNNPKISSPLAVKICFGPIKNNHTFRVTLPLTVQHSKVGSILLHQPPITIKTTATLVHHLFNTTDSKVAYGNTLLVAVEVASRVAWWIILLASLGALAVLGGLIFVMYKCDFFKRKIKTDLKDLKRRSSLMQSKRATAAPSARSALSMHEETMATTEKPATSFACDPDTVRTRPTGLS